MLVAAECAVRSRSARDHAGSVGTTACRERIDFIAVINTSQPLGQFASQEPPLATDFTAGYFALASEAQRRFHVYPEKASCFFGV